MYVFTSIESKSNQYSGPPCNPATQSLVSNSSVRSGGASVASPLPAGADHSSMRAAVAA